MKNKRLNWSWVLAEMHNAFLVLADRSWGLVRGRVWL